MTRAMSLDPLEIHARGHVIGWIMITFSAGEAQRACYRDRSSSLARRTSRRNLDIVTVEVRSLRNRDPSDEAGLGTL